MTEMTAGPDGIATGARWAIWCGLAGLVGFCLTVTVPFLVPFHYFPMNLFYAEWAAFFLGLVAMALAFAATSVVPMQIPAAAVGLLALVMIIAIQVAASYVAYAETAFLISFYAVWSALLMIAAANVRDVLGENRMYSFLRAALALGGVISAAIGFIQYYQIATPWGSFVDVQGLQIGYMFGLVGQRNNFSDYVACGLASMLFSYALGGIRWPVAFFSAVTMSSALALASSRTTLVYFVIIAVVVFMARRGDSEQFKRLGRLAMFSFGIFVATQILAMSTDLLARPGGTATHTVIGRMATDLSGVGYENIRGPLLDRGWRAFLSSPWIGIGAGELTLNMFWQAADIPPPVTPGIIDRHTHNLFLQLLAEFGLAGLLFVGCGLAIWSKSQIRRIYSPNHLWALAVIGIIAAHSMVEFPLWIAHFAAIFAILIGLTSHQAVTVRNFRLMHWTLMIASVCGLGIAAGYLSDYREIETWYLAVEARQHAGQPPTGGDLLALAAHHDGSFFAPFVERVASDGIAISKDGISDKLALNSQVMHAFPTPQVVERQIALLQLAGKSEDAKRAMLAMERIWPLEAKMRLPNFELLASRDPGNFSELARYLQDLIATREKAAIK